MSEKDDRRPAAKTLNIISDMGRIDEYGNEHSDEYGGHWYEDHQRAYGVSFTGSLVAHETALRSLLHFPDRLRVRPCTYSHAYLRQMQEAIFFGENEKGPDGSFRGGVIHTVGVDVIENVVVVRVLPGKPEVEERLANQYGALIRIETGGRAVPL